MRRPSETHRTVALVERVYRALLRAYPRSFHHDVGEDMAEMFRDLARDAWERRGAPGLASLVLSALRDTLVHAPAERLRAVLELRRSTPETHRTRDLWRTADRMDTLLQDLRYTVRGLIARPAFAVLATLTLTLGIGSTTAIFGIVNGVMLRPLPYDQPERLVSVSHVDRNGAGSGWSYRNFIDVREGNRSFEHLTAITGQSVNLTGDGQPERIVGNFVPADYFPTIGVAPTLGRTFRREETELATAERVVVLSAGFWQRRYGGDGGVLGRSLALNGDPYVVVGVMPTDYKMLGETDVWLPITAYPNAGAFEQRARHAMAAFGRLKAGVTLAQAEADLSAIAERLAREYPQENAGRGVRVVPLHEMFVRDVRKPLLIMFGAVGFVLLIACANVANLQLARSAARQKEISVRAALGAGRGRLVRQLLTESLLLAAIGGACGLLFAHWAVSALRAVAFDVVQIDPSIGIDGTVLGFALAVSAGTGMLFGLIPALRVSRVDLAASLSALGRSGTPGVARNRIAGALVVAEVALSLVLLTGAGLLIRSFTRISSVDPGFDARGVLSMEFRLPPSKYGTPERISAFFDDALHRIQSVPGVRSAAMVRAIPFSGNFESVEYRIEGRDVIPGAVPSAQLNTVSPDYFRTLGIPLLQGRAVVDADAAGAPLVAVINDEMARREFGEQNPVGKRVFPVGSQEAFTVVGVVGAVKHRGLSQAPAPQVYLPLRQNPRIFTGLVVRTAGEPLLLASAVRDAIWAVDRDQPVWKIRTLESMVAASTSDERFIMMLMGTFALAALVLASVGIYGTMSYAVAQRTREIGIRMALGAAAGQVLRSVLRQGMTLTLGAVALGLAASYALTRLLASLLYEVQPTDPVTYVAVASLLAFVAFVACIIPALRAARVDPVTAIGVE